MTWKLLVKNIFIELQRRKTTFHFLDFSHREFFVIWETMIFLKTNNNEENLSFFTVEIFSIRCRENFLASRKERTRFIFFRFTVLIVKFHWSIWGHSEAKRAFRYCLSKFHLEKVSAQSERTIMRERCWFVWTNAETGEKKSFSV